MIKLQIIGNLGKDCIVKEVNGKNVINFSVAHTEKYKNAQGESVSKSTWVEAAYWTDKTAIAQYLTKGKMVYLEGQPEADAYLANDGSAKGTLRVRVSQVQLLGGGEQTQQPAPTANSSFAASADTNLPVDDGSLPF